MKLIEDLNWRYATKKFDPKKVVPSSDLSTLKEAIRLSVSSYGLQLYKVLIIQDKELKSRLKPASWHQNQVVDCSHLFVFCNYNQVTTNHIDDYINLIASTRNLSPEQVKGYGDFIQKKIAEKSDPETSSWLQRQPYLAVSNLLIACAQLKIDACPMEGFDPEAYNKILNLEEQGLEASVLTAVGYRDPQDGSKDLAKVRKSASILFEHI